MLLSRILLFAACVVEIGLLTFMRKPPLMGDFHEGFLFLLSLFIGVFPFFLRDPLSLGLHGRKAFVPAWSHWVVPLLGMAGLAAVIPDLQGAFSKYPIEVAQSDIIPQIEVMVRRFFWEGTSPYQTITEFGYPLFSPYMPLHWGPFGLSYAWEIDHRWVAFGIFVLVSAGYFWQLHKQTFPVWMKGLMALLPAFFVWELLLHESHVFGHTVEILITAYYFLMALALLTRNPYLIGLALITCLLSRYSIAFFVPLLLWVVWVSYGRKPAFIIMGVSGLGVLALYVLPFLAQDPTLLSQGLSHHAGVSERAWTFEGWYTPEGRPGVLSWNVGLGRYFFDFWPGPPERRLAAIAASQLIFSIVAAALMGFFYKRVSQRMAPELFLVLAFKIYLTVFYHLYALPFIYMMMVPTVVSFVVLLAVFSRDRFEVNPAKAPF